MFPSFGTILLSGALLLVGVGGGVWVTTTNMLSPHPPVCTIDPLLAEELARQGDIQAHILRILEVWESRQAHMIGQADQRRQQLQRDVLPPGHPTGLGALPTQMKGN